MPRGGGCHGSLAEPAAEPRGAMAEPAAPHGLPGRQSPKWLLLPCTVLLPAPPAPRVYVRRGARQRLGCMVAPGGTGLQQAGLGTGAVSSFSPPLSLPGLHVFAIAFALEVSVGKTNTVMALNNSNVLLPCTFTTCIGFQDLVFTWYFNSTEMVGGSLGFASVFLAGPLVLSLCRSAPQFSQGSLSPLQDALPPSISSSGGMGWCREGDSNTLAHLCSWHKAVLDFLLPMDSFLFVNWS